MSIPPAPQRHSSDRLLSPTTYSLEKSLHSIFALHNETGIFSLLRLSHSPVTGPILTQSQVNIHTHLIGALIFYYFQFRLFSTEWYILQKATVADLIVFSIYFLGVANCFLSSAMSVS